MGEVAGLGGRSDCVSQVGERRDEGCLRLWLSACMGEVRDGVCAEFLC